MFPVGATMAPIDQVLRVILDIDHPLCTTRLVCKACSSPSSIGPFYDLSWTARYMIPIIGSAVPRHTHTQPSVMQSLLEQWIPASRYSRACLSIGPFWPFATTLTVPQIVSFDISNFSVQPRLWLVALTGRRTLFTTCQQCFILGRSLHQSLH